jgi:methionyl-tRNA formyltransferase
LPPTNLLFLGPADSPVLAHLRAGEDTVHATSRPLLWIDPRVRRADFLISHLYLHRVRPWALKRFPRRAVNLHNSLLPHNRGWHAVHWSVIDGTPSGVTIHHMDEHFDTGDIVAQREVPLGDDLTLRAAWRLLQDELLSLFAEEWPAIRQGECSATPQAPGGSYHRKTDLVTPDWVTTVGDLRRRSEGR